MTNKNKKRRESPHAPSRHRQEGPERDVPTPRPGLLGSVFSARGTGATNMPRVRTTFARGVAVVVSTPVILVGTVGGVFVIWLGTLLLGFQGPASSLASALAMPPIGTLFDLRIAGQVLGTDTGSFVAGILGSTLLRSVVIGILLGLAVDVLESGRLSSSGIRRGLLAAPTIVIVSVIEIGFVLVSNVLSQIVGRGLGLFVGVATIAAAVFLLGYAPVAQLREGRGILMSLSRSSAAARIPGSSALAMALLYTVPGLLILQTPAGGLGVNPSPLMWVFVLFANVLHVAVLATYAYRWMCVEDEVPEPVARARSRHR